MFAVRKANKMFAPGQLNSLIADASRKHGSDAALARSLGVPTSTVAAWKTGSRGVPAEYHAIMLTMTGVPFERASAEALLAANAHKKLGQTLARAAGKLTAIFSGFALGVALYTASAFAQPAWAHGASDGDNVYYVNLQE